MAAGVLPHGKGRGNKALSKRGLAHPSVGQPPLGEPLPHPRIFRAISKWHYLSYPMADEIKDWRLKLRYGKLTTPYKHYTILADGEVGQLAEGFEGGPGTAWMAMKAWAESAEEAVEMIVDIAGQIGFTVTGKVEVYATEPEEAPDEEPFGYDIKFTYYDAGAQEADD